MHRVFSAVSEAHAARDTPDTSTQDVAAIYRQPQYFPHLFATPAAP